MTTEGKRGLLGATVALGGQAANLTVLAAAAVVLPRLLGPGDYGLFSAAMAVVAVLFVVSTLGLGAGEVRFLPPLAARGEARAVAELASSFWTVRLLASAAAAAACALWIRLSAADLAAVAALAVALFALARYAFQATRSLLLPLDRIGAYVGLEVLQGVAFLGLFVAGYLEGGLDTAFLAAAAANLALLVAALALVRGRAPLSVARFRAARLSPLLGYNVAAFVAAVASTVRTYLPIWAVAVWGGARQAAYFGLAAQALAWTTMLVAAVQQALLPILSELEESGDDRRVRGWLDWLMRLVAAGLCAGAVVWGLIGRELIAAILGTAYTPAYAPVTLLLLAAIPTAVGTVANALHFLRRRARTGALNVVAACAATLLGLGWALSGIGEAAVRSAWVYLASALFFLTLALASIRRAEGRWLGTRRLAWLLLPAALAWPAMVWELAAQTRVAAAAGFVVLYAAYALGARLIELSELAYLAELLRRR